MTYAYDDYVQMPTKDLYDTAVMKMAIEAAKDMYDKGQAQMENFYKTYGDFMSPFARDMAYYGEKMNNVRQVVNDAYARGIDLFKSPEGRAIVAQLSHSIDPGWYNLARQNAKVGYAYLDSLKEAMRNGTYDKSFEDYLLTHGGPGLFSNFSSENGAVWDRAGVSKFQDINQWTHHLFDNMQLSYDPELSKKYPGFLAYSKNRDTMNKIVKSNIAQLANSDMGKYLISRLEQQGITDLGQQLDLLSKTIVDSNWEEGQVKLEQDPIYLQNLKYQQALDVANIRAAAKTGNTDTEAPTTFMDRLQKNMDSHFEDKNFGPETAKNTIAGIIDYWDKTAKSYEPNGKVTGSEKYKEEKNILEGSYVPGMTISRASKYGTKTEEKERNTYDQKDNPSYNKAVYEKSRWANFANGNYYPSRYDTRKTDDGEYIVNIVRDIIRKGDKATDQEKMFLQSYQQEDLQQAMMKSKSSTPEWSNLSGQRGAMKLSDAKKRASDFWDSFSAEGLSPIQNKVLHQVFMGSDGNIKDPDLPGNQERVRFGSGYHYAPVRQLGVSGSARFKHNDMHSKFDRFLQGEYGISIDPSDVKASGIPHPGHIGRQLDILKHPAITNEQLMSFVDKLRKNEQYKNISVDDVVKTLGLKAVNKKLTYRGKDEQLHSTDTYYEVPVIRTVDNLGGFNFRDINVLSDIIEFNAGVADKNVINSENQSLIDDLPLELATQILQ